MFIVGRYPALSLKDARIGNQAVKALVQRGIKSAQTRREI